MVKLEMYILALVTFGELLMLGLNSTATLYVLLLMVNRCCEYVGIEPQDPAIIPEIGETILRKMTGPFCRRVTTSESFKGTNSPVYPAVIAGITVSITTAFQFVTIPAAAGVSTASAYAFGSPLSMTAMSINLIAFSMILAVAISTHVDNRMREGLQYA